jgi:carboxymethylenebutenolidase
VTITGYGGDAIEAYSARPLTPGPVGGAVVLHHLPGYDRQTKEFTRSLAVGGFNAVMPNLYSREAPGADPDDAMAAARAQGAIPLPDERVVGEVAGAMAYLKGLSNANGKVGVIGHCSGGRQSFLAAVSLPPLVDKTPDLSCPLLGLFGSLDAQPAPEHVAELEAALAAAGKTYKFRTYDGANHGFLQADSARYHPESAVDACRGILDWFGRNLAA